MVYPGIEMKVFSVDSSSARRRPARHATSKPSLIYRVNHSKQHRPTIDVSTILGNSGSMSGSLHTLSTPLACCTILKNLSNWQPNSLLYGEFKVGKRMSMRGAQQLRVEGGRNISLIMGERNASTSNELLITDEAQDVGRELSIDEKGALSSSYTPRAPPRCYKKMKTLSKTSVSAELSSSSSSPRDSAEEGLPNFIGLESGTKFDFMQPILQSFFFLPKFQKLLASHVCDVEFCLSCELGFLYHMFELARLDGKGGGACHSTNLQRVFMHIPGVKALGLLRPERHDSSLTLQAAAFLKFIIENIHKEFGKDFQQHVFDLFGAFLSSTTQCLKMNHQNVFTSKIFMIDMNYYSAEGILKKKESYSGEPNASIVARQTERDDSTDSPVQKASGGNPSPEDAACDDKSEIMATNEEAEDLKEKTTFCLLLEASMKKQMIRNTYCKTCCKKMPSQHTRELLTLPNFLLINCNITDERELQVWREETANNRRFIQSTIWISLAPEFSISHYPVKGALKYKLFFSVFGVCNDASKANLPSESFHLVLHLRYLPPAKADEPQDVQNSNQSVGVSRDNEAIDVLEEKEGEAHEKSSAIVGGAHDSAHTQAADKLTAGEEGLIKPLKDFVSKQTDDVEQKVERAFSYLQASDENANCEAVCKEKWILVNSTFLKTIPVEEVLDFTPPWKIPAILLFIKADLLEEDDEPAASTASTSSDKASDFSKGMLEMLPQSVFTTDKNIAFNPQHQAMYPSFIPLDEEELAKLRSHKFLIALDAEFVALELEAAEIREDGTKQILKSSELSLARVSVIRGEGEREGIPFIDHYIYYKEHPKDYLTRFSGLRPGDLDPVLTQHWLTTRKAVYQKLRFLVDSGCIFVGHGLSTDFRIINMYVPANQIIDTVKLYRLPGQRLISLKFLSAHVLHLKIQQHTHDSVEDARTALALYKNYLMLKKENLLEKTIQGLYEIGYKTQWKICYA